MKSRTFIRMQKVFIICFCIGIPWLCINDWLSKRPPTIEERLVAAEQTDQAIGTVN